MTREEAIERIAVELESAAQTDEADSASIVAYWRILAAEVFDNVVTPLLAEVLIRNKDGLVASDAVIREAFRKAAEQSEARRA